jgi:parvulin-like peptidyl-prolyl isomerase
MNRKKLSIAAFSLVALTALSACSNPLTKNDAGRILTLKDKDGTEIGYTADQLFSQYRGNEVGVAKFVEAITEVVIRNQINQNITPYPALKAEILRKADLSVDGVKETARNNANTNGTNYRKELDTLLESYNVEDLEELKDYFAYQTMKQEIEDRFFKDNKNSFIEGDLATDSPGYLSYRSPYHVKHILVKVSASGSDLYNGRISEAEAKKIHAVGLRLALQKNGETFGEIAREMSEDGSKDQFGDLGIMSKATSFVNEFKLGVYAFDTVFNERTKNLPARTQLGMPTTAVNYFNQLGLAQIPFHAFESLNDYANVTKDVNGNPVNDNDPLYFPRNIIFNEYFNKHNIAVITPESRGGGDYIYPGFRNVPELTGLGKKVLTDEKGRVILAVRAGTGSGESGYQGIHFIVVERSALVNLDPTTGVTLKEYYTTETPSETLYPRYKAGDIIPNGSIIGDLKPTFVSFNVTTPANYKTRAETVNNEIRNFDRFFNFRMLETLLNAQQLEFADEALENAILNYFDISRRSADFEQGLQDINTWNGYIEFLEYQSFQRERLIDETCAHAYLTNLNSAYNIGGPCYVQK